MGNSAGNGYARTSHSKFSTAITRKLLIRRPPGCARVGPAVACHYFLLCNLLMTLSVRGADWDFLRAESRAVFGYQGPFAMLLLPFQHPGMLLLGVPFSLTLLGFFIAHEMGHFLACKYYGIDCSYPFFLPSPFPFGTFGAVIRIRAPITTRRALFDIGIAGPILGFIVAVPLTAYGIAASKVIPGVQDDGGLIYGFPALMKLFIAMFHPGTETKSLLFHPVALAAWIGLLATALNLLPVWQLDGGHILYSLAPERHQRLSLAAAVALVFMGVGYWHAGRSGESYC